MGEGLKWGGGELKVNGRGVGEGESEDRGRKREGNSEIGMEGRKREERGGRGLASFPRSV